MKSLDFLAHRNIIRGGLLKYLEVGVELPSMRMKGHFKVELLDRAGRVKRCLDFDNLITNGGFDSLGNGTAITSSLAYCAVGTGSTTPAITDTSLVAEISPSSTNRSSSNGGISDANSYVSGTPDFGQLVRTFLLDFGQGNGNLTEIGIFSALTSGTMFTRQLLKDSGGTPTTITKTSSDQLRVTYTIQMYPPQSDSTGTVSISGTSTTWTGRAANVGAPQWSTNVFNAASSSWGGSNTEVFDGALGARTSSPAGSATFATGASHATYGSGNFYFEVTTTWSAASVAATLKAIAMFSNSGTFMQMGFSPSFVKSNTQQLQLVYRITWGAYP